MWLEGVFPNNTHANCWDRSNATAGLNRAWREWQPHAEDLAPSWKCKMRQVSIALWCKISNGFWGVSSLRPFMSLPFPSSVSLLVLCWTFHPRPYSPGVCTLNSSNYSFEGQSHKTSFYAGPVSLMGLSLCTMLRSEPQNFRQAWPQPRRWIERQIRPHERQGVWQIWYLNIVLEVFSVLQWFKKMLSWIKRAVPVVLGYT